MVAFAVGPNRMDPTCVGKISLPHMLMNSDPSKSERFFSVGNEKTPASFNPPWIKNQVLGYHLYGSDKFSFIVDLMNQNKEDKTVYMYLTYDYVEGRPKGIDSIKVRIFGEFNFNSITDDLVGSVARCCPVWN
jgi:O-glycosyl hydrolase